MDAEHPDLNAIGAFGEGRLSGGARAALVEHLATCFECRTLLAALVPGLAETPEPRLPLEVGVVRAFFPGRIAWLPLAASVAFATTVGLAVWRSEEGRGGRAVPPLASLPPDTKPPPDPSLPSASPLPLTTPTPQPTRDPIPDPPDVRRGGSRRVDGKTFRLVAGEWIDADYDPLGLLPTEHIEGPEARAQWLARVPDLAPYARLGTRVTVVRDGVVYRFRP